MRKNLVVARPLDLMVMTSARTERTLVTRIEKEDPSFDATADRWSELRVNTAVLAPDPQFMGPGDAFSPLSVVGGSGIG